MSEANGAVFMPGAFGAVQAELTVSLSSEQGPPCSSGVLKSPAAEWELPLYKNSLGLKIMATFAFRSHISSTLR